MLLLVVTLAVIAIVVGVVVWDERKRSSASVSAAGADATPVATVETPGPRRAAGETNTPPPLPDQPNGGRQGTCRLQSDRARAPGSAR